MNLLHFLKLLIPMGLYKACSRDKGLLSNIDKLIDRFSNDTSTRFDKTLHDLKYRSKLRKQAIALYQLTLQDRQNARARDLSKKHNTRADIMVFGAGVALFVCIGLLLVCKHILTVEMAGIISAFIAIFGSCLKDAYAFEFGRKNDRESFEPTTTRTTGIQTTSRSKK